MKVLFLVVLVFVTAPCLPQSMTLGQLTGPGFANTPYLVNKEQHVSDVALTPTSKKGFVFAMALSLMPLRAEDPESVLTFGVSKRGAVLCHARFHMNDVATSVSLEVDRHPTKPGTLIKASIATSKRLSEPDLRAFWEDFLLKATIGGSLQDAPKFVASYDAIGPFWSLPEMMVKMAIKTGKPQKYMTKEEVRRAFGPPTEVKRVIGKDMWEYDSKRPDGLIKLMIVNFDDNGIVEDFTDI